jgi:hypothetical protein
MPSKEPVPLPEPDPLPRRPTGRHGVRGTGLAHMLTNLTAGRLDPGSHPHQSIDGGEKTGTVANWAQLLANRPWAAKPAFFHAIALSHATASLDDGATPMYPLEVPCAPGFRCPCPSRHHVPQEFPRERHSTQHPVPPPESGCGTIVAGDDCTFLGGRCHVLPDTGECGRGLGRSSVGVRLLALSQRTDAENSEHSGRRSQIDRCEGRG